MDYYIGVDVGTGSVRAAMFTAHGKLKNICTHSIETFNSIPYHYEQSSDEIWGAVCCAVKNLVHGTPKEFIKGIGFDATCSLVVLDEYGEPVTTSLTGDNNQNVILWFDHRAEAEADFINMIGDEMLKYVGGKISPEMEIPKILWLKKNLPKSWSKAQLLFDLPDFLTWKATGCQTRSHCSLVCKWNYAVDPSGQNGWNANFFEKIGLSMLKDNNWRRIGNEVQVPGEPIGNGLSSKAADEMGLNEGTPVGTSIIDAHAGGLGMIGCAASGISNDFTARLSLVCGTSTCHVAISSNPIFVRGVWGPYYNAMIPSFWLNEGGQSATGKLLDYIIDTHPAAKNIRDGICGEMYERHIQKHLSDILQSMANRNDFVDVSFITKNLHVWPDFHGNRSPIADATLQGMISGLTLASDEENLAIMYLATMQALTYGTKHILEELIRAGHKIESIVICGGLSQNVLFTQMQADVLNLPVLIPNQKESVLLGAAILGAYASGSFKSVNAVIQAMAGDATIISPNSVTYQYHCRKYEVFRKMLNDQNEYKKIMNFVA